jgi:hypothetical protein
MNRPLLFVDIDGVLNAYGGPCPEGYTEHWLFPEDDEPVRVSQQHSVWLHQLAESFDLMWGSSWTVEDRAILATVLTLPPFLGAVDLPRGQFDPALKIPAIERAAEGQLLAWMDDLLTPEAWTWAESRPAPTLLIPIDPAAELTGQHVRQLLDWARGLAAIGSSSLASGFEANLLDHP